MPMSFITVDAISNNTLYIVVFMKKQIVDRANTTNTNPDPNPNPNPKQNEF